ncbi:hypothetical protein GCM10023185_17000 [Hymenobacter saemangeumensis]|uniref:Uncharacterized protein n=1 Tax=Hymenobacter saemangeumensis TaxID=1084522 RepID=A0ABP8IAQ6_9BACT
MNPTPFPLNDPPVPAMVLASSNSQIGSQPAIPPLRREDVRAEVEAELEKEKKGNFYAWWLACEGYGSVF